MTDAFGYGPIISDEEYRQRVTELYRHLPPAPSKEMDLEVRRAELDLLIDHRLGCHFPPERRDALWEAQRQIDKKRVRLAFASITRALLPGRFRRGVDGLATFAVDEYGKVLSRQELSRFLEDGKPPQLPLERG